MPEPRNALTRGQRISASFRAAIGDIAFGMTDGAVSVAGLVFGVAAGSTTSNSVVLAGATGATAAAVSMMAGRYLDVQSQENRDATLARLTRTNVLASPERYLESTQDQLVESGVGPNEAAEVTAVLRRHPEALAWHVVAERVGTSRSSTGGPWLHSVWMFGAVLLAGSVPIIPFAILDIDQARALSLILTAALLVLLGILRARIGGMSVPRTAAQTLAIGAAATAAGIAIGRLVT